MQSGRPNGKWGKVAHHSKTAWRIVRWAAVAILFVLGLAQVPDEAKVWQGWFDAMMAEPHVTAAAQWFADAAKFHNLWPVRLGLWALGLTLLFWTSRPVWRARHAAVYWARRTVEEKVWISQDTAFRILSGSRWAKNRKLAAEPPSKIYDLALKSMMTNDPAEQARLQRFGHWCRKALDAFAEDVPDAFRQSGDTAEYDEAQLKAYLAERFDHSAINEFGPPR